MRRTLDTTRNARRWFHRNYSEGHKGAAKRQCSKARRRGGKVAIRNERANA